MLKLSKPQMQIYNMEKFLGNTNACICGSFLIPGNMSKEVLTYAVNELYCLNDALRICIRENHKEIGQSVQPFQKRLIEQIAFHDKEALFSYASDFAAFPMDIYGDLCKIKIITTESHYGILVKIHHIIGDAWTLSLICSQFYQLVHGEIPKTYSYIEYLETEKDYITSKRYEKDRSYWMRQFEKCCEPTYLSEKSTSDLKAKRLSFTLDKELTKRLFIYAKQHHISFYDIMMTIVSIYFNRTKYNKEKFFIGTAILNRSGISEKNTVGMYVNTVPVLIELDNRKTFLENLLYISACNKSVIRHSKYNYGDILSDLKKQYHFDSKLYDIVLNYQNAKIIASEDHTESVWYPCHAQGESLQIHIEDRDDQKQLKMHYDYQTAKFNRSDIQTMHVHIKNLLIDAIQHPKKTISELDLLTKEETHELLYTFNDTQVGYPKHQCIHELFEEQVKKHPDKIAVVAKDKTFTYRQLNELSEHIACNLLQIGIQNQDIVAVALPRNSYLIPVILGILKAGAAYLPIDLNSPQDRTQYMIEDSGARLFITDKNLPQLLKYNKKGRIHVSVLPTQICYCIYTSGSTGKPKGTMISHKNLNNFCCANTMNAYQSTVIQNCNCVLATYQTCFDAFGVDTWLFLLNGKTVVLAGDTERMNASALARLAVQYHVDVIQSTPTMISAMCMNKEYTRMLKDVKTIMVAAEPLLGSLYQKLRTYTTADIYNGYGPSETTIGIAFGKIENSTDIHIGGPISNTQIYIVDHFMNPVPIGINGELCVAGDSVGQGYLHRTELTEKNFICNPFGEGKLYRTGDIACWQKNGTIRYIGRTDFQVKVHGMRIELNEIENILCNYNGILQSAALIRKNDNNKEFIYAFYQSQEEIPEKELREFLRKKLPQYMIPHSLIHVDSIPVTTNGKVDKMYLQKMISELKLNRINISMPVTGNEELLLAFLKEILNLEQISMEDHFLDIGGDSLTAIELAEKLEQHGRRLSIQDIFNSTDLRETASKMIFTELRKTELCHSDTITATPAQMRIYFAQSRAQNTVTYNMPYILKTEYINAEKLQECLEVLLQRHDILRVHFENSNGRIVQILNVTVPFEIEYPQDEISFVKPFNLSSAPLFRVGILNNEILIDIHHIIADGVSIPILMSELNDLYMGRELTAPAVSYMDFAKEQEQYLGSKLYKKQEQYWLSVFSGTIPKLNLRKDKLNNSNTDHEGHTYYAKINTDLTRQIEQLITQMNITPYTYFLSAFYILLSKYADTEDIIIGTPMSGRNHGNYFHTIGMFVNTIAMRNQPSADKTICNFVGEVKEQVLTALENQDYPLGDLIQKLKISSYDGNPLFRVMFAYQDKKLEKIVFADKKIQLYPIETNVSKYDLTFNIIPYGNETLLNVEYASALYFESTIQRMITGYLHILKQMTNINCRIGEMDALTEDQNFLLQSFNNTHTLYPKHQCIHELFEAQVKKHPDKQAVIACDKSLTYAELNEQANLIAHSLMERGVKVGNIVAFILHRKSILFSAMLGILKSGAAYMPISPDYPKERIDYMLADSQAAFCITEENIRELLMHSDSSNPCVSMDSVSLCYCIYTSGSTGKPKGTLIRHRNMANYCRNDAVCSAIVPYKTVAAITNVCFDVFGTESIFPLINGMTAIFADEKQMMTQRNLNKLLMKYPSDILQATPTKLRMLIADKKQLGYLKHIQIILLGGEPFDISLYHELKNYTHAKIFNAYGPTETTICTAVEEIISERVTIGAPTANTQIYIVDKHMNQTPIGVAGELCIAGDCVGAGYLNRPELTKAKFVDNPFGEGKLYKTGDLAWWREDGKIVYVGRNDFQVKIHGLRMELGEIENAIANIEGISQTIVVVRKDERDTPYLCAFYTGTQAISDAMIRKELATVLPKYMIPQFFLHLETMPMTPGGKIDRNALPEVDLHMLQSHTAYVPPEGELEHRLASIMEKVLHHSPIGREDDFFELGGDSLKAIEFAAKAHYDGILFDLQAVFEHPNVMQLASYIHNGNRNMETVYHREDFLKYQKLLANNSSVQDPAPEQALGNILLTGATGFLGSHILHRLLREETGKIYCLVREDAARLKEVLTYYFGREDAENERILPVIGSLESLEFLNISKVDMVIHAAASVKHYGSYQHFYEVNVEGTKNAINFAKRKNAIFLQISTLSVSGMEESTNKIVDFDERNLYIGQKLDNVYVRSKFEAERLVLDAALDGLSAGIIRVGNLTNRITDGMFQKNYESNAFLKRVKAFLELGCFPDYLKDAGIEFSPVDETAEAILTIAKHFDGNRTVFHGNNPKMIPLRSIIQWLSKMGIHMEEVPGKLFLARLKEPEQHAAYETLSSDLNSEEKLAYRGNIRVYSSITSDYLKACRFEWSDITPEYLQKYIDYFKNIHYLEV